MSRQKRASHTAFALLWIGFTKLLALALLSLGLAGIAWAEDGVWRRIETANFVVFSQGEEVKARRLALDMEMFRATLLQNAPPARSIEASKFRIVMTGARSLFREFNPRFGGSVAGFYSASPDLITAYASFSEATEEDIKIVLFHEFAHHYMLQYFPGYYPDWYVEGFAEFYSTVKISSTAVDVGDVMQWRASALTGGGWLPLEDILKRPATRGSSETVDRFYSQSWLFVHYLTFDAGRQRALVDYLNALRRGEDPIAAFEPAFGRSVAAMQEELRAYVRTRLPKMRYTRTSVPAPTEVTVTRLPKGADRLLVYIDRMRARTVGGAEAKAFWDQLPERTNGIPNTDPWLIRLRAWAALRAQEYPEAFRAAEALLALNAQDADAFDVIAQAHIGALEGQAVPEDRQQEVLAKAIAALDSALAIEPNRAGALMRRAMATVPTDAASDEERLARFVAARRAAPQVGQFAIVYAEELQRRGRTTEAVRVLRPLTADPHGGSMAEKARELIAQWSSAQTPAAQPASTPQPVP